MAKLVCNCNSNWDKHSFWLSEKGITLLTYEIFGDTFEYCPVCKVTKWRETPRRLKKDERVF